MGDLGNAGQRTISGKAEENSYQGEAVSLENCAYSGDRKPINKVQGCGRGENGRPARKENKREGEKGFFKKERLVCPRLRTSRGWASLTRRDINSHSKDSLTTQRGKLISLGG